MHQKVDFIKWLSLSLFMKFYIKLIRHSFKQNEAKYAIRRRQDLTTNLKKNEKFSLNECLKRNLVKVATLNDVRLSLFIVD
jgi:hypothetical protein